MERIITEELLEQYRRSLYNAEKSPLTIKKYIRDVRKLMKYAAETQNNFSKLPVVYINTEDGNEVTSRIEKKNASMYVQGNELYDSQYNGTITIKARGNQSYFLPKKPYKIKLNTSTNMFAFGKNKHWVLLANYRDESLVRNTIANDISVKMGLIGADTTWVDVVMNGSYVGNYQFCEQIRVDKNRIDIFDWDEEAESIAKAIYNVEKNNGMTKEDRDNIEDNLQNDYSWVSDGNFIYNDISYNIDAYYERNAAVDGGYIFELNTYNAGLDGARDPSEFNTSNGMRVVVNTPEMSITNNNMMNYCKQYWNGFEAAYASADGYDENHIHYTEYADFDSMVNYWLLNEIVGNNDALNRSRWCYKDLDNVLYFGPVWDFDYGFGTAAVGYNAKGWKFSLNANVNNLFKNWIDDPYFVIKAQEKYWEIRPFILSIISEDGLLDEYYTYIKESGAANEDMWLYSRGFKSDTESVRSFLQERICWLDEQFATQDSGIKSLYSNNSTYPYTKSSDMLPISFLNSIEDNSEESIKADAKMFNGYDLKMLVGVNDISTLSLGVYVNGLLLDKYKVSGKDVDIIIPEIKLSEDNGTKNVISIIGFDEDNKVTYTNFATVIQQRLDIIEGSLYMLNADGDISYDVTVPHILINQVYGGKKSASYASNDFIELYNPTDEDVDLSGWSLQYRSSIDGGDNTSWSKLDLTGTIKSHCSYLVKCKAATGTEDWHINIDDCDQEWKQKLNNKGCTVVLVANNGLIDPDSLVFDNDTGQPVISGYVDMVGVSGNDVSSEEDINNEAALYYEKEASKVQSRKSAIRRKAFADTDDNTVEGDFEVVDYSFENADYIAYISPKCTADGPWTYDEDAVPKYTVTIDKNIKGEDVTELKYTYNTLFDAPEEPVREGYTFTGWFADKGLTKEYDFTKKTVSDVTLYAGWKVNSYTITFESNGGGSVQAVTKDYGSRVIEREEPEYVGGGYTFAGWYSDEALETPYEFSTMPAEDITLYAKWDINSYTIRFVTNSGSTVKAITADYGSELAAPEEPVREGYSFTGWYSDRKLTTPYKFTTMPAGNVTLYAGWTPVTSRVSFDTAGGNDMAETDVTYGEDGVVAEPVKTGYTFTGWYVDEACTIPYDPDKAYSGSITLHAGWKVKEYTVRWVDHDGTVLKSEKVGYSGNGTAPEAPYRAGYTFTGWSSTAENVTANLTVQAEYEKISIVLSAKYDMPGNDSAVTVTDENGSSISEITLYTKKYKTAQFTGKVIGSGLSVTWSSSDDSVALVSSKGKVSVKKAGVTYITAEAGGASVRCKVTVKQVGIKAVLNGKVANSKRITLKKGAGYKLKVTAIPDGKVTYKSKNKKIATVSAKGTITTKKKGKTTIVISSNGMKKTVKIKVK